ncbi:unnamed protein product [Arabidopsis lyrata]|nr:unnamed protein product [Arabidopsis lyrata]
MLQFSNFTQVQSETQPSTSPTSPTDQVILDALELLTVVG